MHSLLESFTFWTSLAFFCLLARKEACNYPGRRFFLLTGHHSFNSCCTRKREWWARRIALTERALLLFVTLPDRFQRERTKRSVSRNVRRWMRTSDAKEASEQTGESWSTEEGELFYSFSPTPNNEKDKSRKYFGCSAWAWDIWHLAEETGLRKEREREREIKKETEKKSEARKYLGRKKRANKNSVAWKRKQYKKRTGPKKYLKGKRHKKITDTTFELRRP